MERGGVVLAAGLDGGRGLDSRLAVPLSRLALGAAPVGTILVAGVRPQAWVKRVFLYLKAAEVVLWS